MLAASTLSDVARIVLGAALLGAAIAKIAAGTRWVDQAAELAVPRPMASALPWAELAVGSSVAVGIAEPWPAAIALALLAAFTAWIVVHLVSGERPPCACFGALSAAQLSWWDVARNGVLIALALLAINP